jgi:oligosaccharide repeat unit polymerase
MRLTSAERALKEITWLCIGAGMAGFLGGSLLAASTNRLRTNFFDLHQPEWRPEWDRGRAILALTAMAVCAIGALLFSYAGVGQFPLFAADSNYARFRFFPTSLVARFAIVSSLVLTIALVLMPFWKRSRFYLILLACVPIAIFTLITSRAYLVSACYLALVIYHYGRRRLDVKRIVLWVGIFAALKTGIDYYRFHQDEVYQARLRRIGFPEAFSWMGPDYLYVAMNFATLDGVIDVFPDELPYQWGWYSAYPIRCFWTERVGNGFRDRLDDILWERSARWFGLTNVTATYLAVPYADFGLLGAFGFSLLFGFVSEYAYLRMLARRTFPSLFLNAGLSWAVSVSFFANHLTLLDFYWNIAVVLIFHSFASRAVRGRTRMPRLVVLAPGGAR